jgi:hypothetical protein
MDTMDLLLWIDQTIPPEKVSGLILVLVKILWKVLINAIKTFVDVTLFITGEATKEVIAGGLFLVKLLWKVLMNVMKTFADVTPFITGEARKKVIASGFWKEVLAQSMALKEGIVADHTITFDITIILFVILGLVVLLLNGTLHLVKLKLIPQVYLSIEQHRNCTALVLTIGTFMLGIHFLKLSPMYHLGSTHVLPYSVFYRFYLMQNGIFQEEQALQSRQKGSKWKTCMYVYYMK